MAINQTPLNVPTYVSTLFKDLLLKPETLERSVAQMLPMAHNKMNLDRFTATTGAITAAVETPSTTADNITKDEKTLTMAEVMYYNEFNPKNFNVEPKYLQSIGPSVDAQAAAVLLSAIREKVVEVFGYDIENLLWNGDTASGSDYLSPIDGFIKQIDADNTVNNVTPAGAITAANVIDIFEAVIQATPTVVKESGMCSIVTSHTVKYLYRQAARALDFKGTNITEAVRDLYGGYPIISLPNVPANRAFTMMTGGGEKSALKVGVWNDADRYNVKIDRLQANSDLFFIKINMELGVSHIWGKEITEYSPA
jgi:hypothetical protein